MRCLFLLCFLCLAAVLKGEEKPSLVEKRLIHLSIGSGPYPLPLPVLSAGYRAQSGHSGFDLTLSMTSVYYLSQIKITPSYLFYINPSIESELYIGLGVQGGSIAVKKSKTVDFFTASPIYLFGKEYLGKTGEKRFIQLEVGLPTYNFSKKKGFWSEWNILYIPLICVTYGICF